MKNNETGRSMVEMLGVLAIIGVLSAGGLAGYSKAMFKHKLNTTMDQITMLVTNIRTMYGTQGNYVGLNARQAVKLGVVPAVMVGDGHDKGGKYMDGETEKTYGEDGQDLTNPFKGAVRIATINVAGGTDDASGFTLTYEGLPKEACIALATADFGSGAGSGFIGTQIDQQTASGIYGNSTTSPEGNAYSMSQALGENGCQEGSKITWYFY